MPYYVYVIELDDAVRTSRRFSTANPDASRKKPCLYVGSSVRPPDQRFDQHKQGYRSNSFVRRYGLRLRPDLFEQYNPIPKRADAVELESYLTDRLRSKGFAVWSN